jgi:Ni/Co efflux regulator RcnB
MRKFILPLLLAGVAASPAIAGPRDDADHPARADRAERAQVREERQQAREERQQIREDRPQFGGERPQLGGERPQFNGGGRFNGAMGGGQPQFARPDRGDAPGQAFGGRDRNGGQADVEGPRGRFEGNGETEVAPGPRMVRNPWGGGRVRPDRGDDAQQALEGRTQNRGPRMVTSDDLRQPDRPNPRVLRTRPPLVSSVPREGTQPPLRAEGGRRHSSSNWSTGWRNDHRYDWRDWRRRHHSWFHLGLYYDPFGWGYSPFSIGWRMWPSYYGSNYWINDPWAYRLPYAPPGYRWIRYYDDAILVDTWTGEVVDVIYNFFW